MKTAPSRLVALLEQRRHQLGLSSYAVARDAGISRSTYRRIADGTITEPRADNLQAIADVLDLPVGDVFAAAGWLGRHDLPTLGPYLRTKYHFGEEAIKDIQAAISQKYGITFDRATGGPRNGEDE